MAEVTEEPRGIAATCLVETAEGPVPMADTPGKGFAVLTRRPSGALGFRQLIKVVSTAGVPLVRVTLDAGHAVLVARGHPFYRLGMAPVPACRLAPGDLLETAFAYPEGYVPPDAAAPCRGRAIAVRAVEAAGTGTVLTGTVRETHALFLTAGVLCGE
ncbi:MAG TPA: hypothetical protein VKW76_00765 [Candidatus Binatia bacterium]|nr:hypothetical protein [Candidatus Binatia bacterium]